MTLQIIFRNHIKSMEFHLSATVLMIIALYFMNFDKNAVIIFFLFWLFYGAPAWYLHLEYYLKNRNQKLEILENEIILYDRNGEVREYANQDLQKIILYKSSSLDKGGIQLSSIESYHYARIIPKQGKDIIITCLMAPNVEDALKHVKWVSYERKKKLFAGLNFNF